ncbi:MAG: response regulator transcription factor [Oscillospiraceae bacterium]|nr:response regulator transcription factor [Oscillospiraceae bacterium]
MRILVAEDEKDLSRALSAVLANSGYEVDIAENGKVAVELAKEKHYDAMVLDIMMPVMDGTAALRTIREGGDFTPALFLTAKAEISDKVTGLDSGADDYLTKPFSMAELLARLRSMTRRAEGYTPHRITAGTVTLNVDEQELSCANSVRISGREAKLMSYFMMNRDREISTDELFTHVWSDEQKIGPDVVWVYINYLRNKLISINADISIEGEKDGNYRLNVG